MRVNTRPVTFSYPFMKILGCLPATGSIPDSRQDPGVLWVLIRFGFIAFRSGLALHPHFPDTWKKGHLTGFFCAVWSVHPIGGVGQTLGSTEMPPETLESGNFALSFPSFAFFATF